MGSQSVSVRQKSSHRGPGRGHLLENCGVHVAARADAALFEERAAEIAQQRYQILTGFGMFAKAPKETAQFPDYPNSLPQRPSGNFPRFMHLTFHREDE